MSCPPFDLKVGDYCYAYTKGIHKVISIIFPSQGLATTALVNLESVLDSKFNKLKGRKSSCDVAWCRRVTLETLLEERKNSYVTQINNLKESLV